MSQEYQSLTGPDDQEAKQNDESKKVIDNPEDLIENEPLVSLFGDHARTRILMALLDAYPKPMNPTAIVEKANISRQSWYRHHEGLLDAGIMEKVGNAGNSPLYALVDDDDDARVEWLQKLRDWTGAYQRSGHRPKE